jgi:hemerythrin-like domain-containing protein
MNQRRNPMTDQQISRRLPEWAIMYALHDAFRRDLDALLATRASLAVIRARWAVFRDQLEFHHTAEDQVIWPRVRAKLTGDPDGLALLDEMEDEHKLIDPLLAEVEDALAIDGENDRLVASLSRLRSTLASHLTHEETGALPMISMVMTTAGVAEIFKAFGRVGGLGEGLKRGAVMFPWALSEADPAIRAEVLSRLPPPARLLYRAVWVPRYRRNTPAL